MIRVPSVVPQHQNAHTIHRLAEDQVIGKGRKVGPPIDGSRHAVKAHQVPLDDRNQCLELILETPRKVRTNGVVIMAQRAPKVFPNEAITGQEHRRPTTASRPV